MYINCLTFFFINFNFNNFNHNTSLLQKKIKILKNLKFII